MSFMKRAVLYIARKWQQSVIAFLILLAVCTSTLIGLSIWARFRIRETGIMLALGESKVKILAQRMVEIALIAVLAFSLSDPASSMTANSVGNVLLTQANKQITSGSPSNTIQAKMPITSDDFDLSPVFAVPQIEELEITVTGNIFAAVYSLGLLAGLVSVCVASVPAMRMNPTEIMSKMS